MIIKTIKNIQSDLTIQIFSIQYVEQHLFFTLRFYHSICALSCNKLRESILDTTFKTICKDQDTEINIFSFSLLDSENI